jgi:hypothetical protein
MLESERAAARARVTPSEGAERPAPAEKVPTRAPEEPEKTPAAPPLPLPTPTPAFRRLAL